MSDDIPFKIQAEIIKRFPVKSLIRFRSVSKQWKSLIDSSEFITDHSVNQNQPSHLLIKYYVAYKIKFVSIVDDDCFPNHKFSPPIDLLSHASLLDCSHGLVCLYGFSEEYKRNLVVLWNPLIRKSVGVVVPYGLTAVGAGVCPKTSDPKIVKIVDRSTVDWKAEVFTLSTGTWRSVSVNLRMPFELIGFDHQVVVDGVIYWLTYSVFNVSYKTVQIISFDLTSEEFGQVALPDGLSKSESGNLFTGKLKESLVLLDFIIDGLVCDVWKMIENGSFTKLFKLDFKTLDSSAFYAITGFRMNGEVILEVQHEDLGAIRLKVYAPCSKQINDLEIDAADYNMGFEMASYTESLLLLNQSVSIIQ